jgi:hypothetical protein
VAARREGDAEREASSLFSALTNPTPSADFVASGGLNRWRESDGKASIDLVVKEIKKEVGAIFIREADHDLSILIASDEAITTGAVAPGKRDDIRL